MNGLPSLIGVAAALALLAFVGYAAEIGIHHFLAGLHVAGFS